MLEAPRRHEADEGLGLTDLLGSQSHTVEHVILAAADEKHHFVKEIRISY